MAAATLVRRSSNGGGRSKTTLRPIVSDTEKQHEELHEIMTNMRLQDEWTAENYLDKMYEFVVAVIHMKKHQEVINFLWKHCACSMSHLGGLFFLAAWNRHFGMTRLIVTACNLTEQELFAIFDGRPNPRLRSNNLQSKPSDDPKVKTLHTVVNALDYQIEEFKTNRIKTIYFNLVLDFTATSTAAHGTSDAVRRPDSLPTSDGVILKELQSGSVCTRTDILHLFLLAAWDGHANLANRLVDLFTLTKQEVCVQVAL